MKLKSLLLIAAFLALAAWFVGASASFQACVYEAQHEAAEHSAPKSIAYLIGILNLGSRCTGEFIHKNGEAIIAIFTVILGVATILLWSATRDLVRSAEKTAERQLRAYVSVMGCRMKIFQVGQEVVVTLTVKNTGQTPAYDTIVVTAIEFRKLPVNSNLILDQPDEMSRTTLGPSQEVLPTAYGGRFLKNEEWLAVSEGKAAIFVYGKIKYRTAFDAHPTTDFRYFFDSVSLKAADGSMRVAIEGNEST